ncbi:hypothetical protein A3A67_04780 [Candidatus Peribacteria bacterium RIFCSPLOWO2_01_FULL_51_18]|nr:MAG: hypothetical protein A3C52_02755 [Candidatus Peribacteria bacterium RIFCSPHIGHO2_02_FULL_51_15]OGJ66066.1 MAG: hypothetical protein A3A67_04780 [Candidatus Peribacteria bacterium RIFCSPLOWO2_01_FULL_51_18]OGJ69873.1 MAG: hypothetical protein A3J34_03035 [Candidatus Peribacteria bacterium RIFCSPLOWO2_02_FULL_51_10]
MLHGLGGSPEENWFPWFKRRLEPLGHKIINPQFPHAEAPSLTEWLRAFQEHRENMPEKTVIIGHSLGATFALRVLERLSAPVLGAFLVAPVSGKMGNDFDPLVKNFLEAGFDWEKIRRNSGYFTVLHGEGDPFIPLEQSQELAKNLGCRLVIVPEGGHLSKSAGFTEFPALLEMILMNTSLLSKNSSML